MNFFNQNLYREISDYMEAPLSSDERKKAVGKRLAEIRTRVGLTQKDVCSIIEITPQTYSGYEKGKHEPSIETLVRLSILYGTSLDFMLCLSAHEDEDTKQVEYAEQIGDNERLDTLAAEVALLNERFKEIMRIQKQEKEKAPD